MLEGLEVSEILLSTVLVDNEKFRIDSLYFSKPVLEAERLVGNLLGGFTTFGDAASVFRKGIFDIKADTYVDEGVPFVRISNLKNGLINDTEIACITEEAHLLEQNTALVYGDIVLSKTAYAAASFVNIPRCNVSQDTVAVKISPEWHEKLKPAFVVSYLNSKYGNRLLTRQFQGNVQMHLSLPDGEKVKLPLISERFQTAVENVFIGSFQKAKDADARYYNAEQILLEALVLDTWQPPEPNAYEATFASAFADDRLDAEHFQPKYAELIQHVKAQAERWCTVADFTAFCDRGTQPLYTESGTLAVVNSRHILEAGLDYDNFERTDAAYWHHRDFVSARIQRGDILTYTTGAKIGRTAVYLDDAPALASNHVNLLRVENENPVYVAVVLNSLIGRMQTRRDCTGSAQVEIYPDDIRGFVVPFVSEEAQAAITQAVEEAHHARARAKYLLETAKRAVEVAIEQGEDAGLALLNEA